MKVELMPFQLEMLRRDNEPLLIACCGVGSGKSYAASVYIAKCLCEEQRIIAGAQGFTALNRVLFDEVKKRLTEWGIPYEHNKTDKEIRVGRNGVVFGATSENPDAILGLTDINTLVLDEASYLCEELFNWGSDRLRGKDVDIGKVRLFTSPDSFNPAHAWFLQLCASNPRCVINASSLENRYTSKQYKDDLLKRYPPGTVLYDQQILGKIVDSRMANAAVDDREFRADRPQHVEGSPVWVGVDCAGQGRDDSFFSVIDDYGIVELRRRHGGSTQELVSEMLDINRTYNVLGAAIDTTGGFGLGLFDYTKTSVKGMQAINFAGAPDKDCFNNVRTEMYFDLRDATSGSHFYCPITDDGMKIREEARYVLYIIDNRGKTALIPKEDVKKSVGRSPDALDSLCLAVRAKKKAGEQEGRSNDSRTIAMRMLRAHGL